MRKSFLDDYKLTATELAELDKIGGKYEPFIADLDVRGGKIFYDNSEHGKSEWSRFKQHELRDENSRVRRILKARDSRLSALVRLVKHWENNDSEKRYSMERFAIILLSMHQIDTDVDLKIIDMCRGGDNFIRPYTFLKTYSPLDHSMIEIDEYIQKTKTQHAIQQKEFAKQIEEIEAKKTAIRSSNVMNI